MAEKANKKTGKAITIQLKAGLRGCTDTQIATVKGLGLRRRMDTVTLENTPSVRGAIKKVIHLVSVVSQS